MAGLSESVSKNIRRGRPALYRGASFDEVRRHAPGKTTRSLQNAVNMLRARDVLQRAGVSAAAVAGLGRTILAELGRVRDPVDVVALARTVAAEWRGTREAVAYIRRTRFTLAGRTPPGPSARAVTQAVVAVLNAYARRHPDVTADQLAEGLKRVKILGPAK